MDLAPLGIFDLRAGFRPIGSNSIAQSTKAALGP